MATKTAPGRTRRESYSTPVTGCSEPPPEPTAVTSAIKSFQFITGSIVDCSVGFDFTKLKGSALSSNMNNSDIVGFVLFSSFGLWWIIAPQSVIRFYTWFHRGKLSPMPTPTVIRIIGLLVVVLMVCITLFQAPR